MKAAWQGLSAAWYRGAWWLWLLRPLELLFRIAVRLRRTLYQWGVVKTYRAPRPVVVVGNITVGGSGKTPVVVALVEALGERGVQAGVVSRGYGARTGNFPRVLGADSTAQDCGDEPLLIYRRTGAPCVVSPSRVDAVQALLQQFPVDLIISDDGLQHYALDRDMEIALMDAAVGLGNRFCLPAGPLREPARRLESVDFSLERGGDGAPVSYRPDCLVRLDGTRELPPDPAVLGAEVYAVAGIGQPQQFADTLQELGFRPSLVSFPDHHSYRAGDLAGLDDRPIIMTEKDAVKCASFAGANSWFLRISAELPAQVVEAVVTLAEHRTTGE
jgi:tetraacyldisaccharide 4'-kinase